MLFVLLLAIVGAVALTSIAGGLAMALGTSGGMPAELQLPVDFLTGSPFNSYLIPGILLAVVVGGLHATAFFLLLRRRPHGPLVTATAGYSILMWIFVQMALIPFSALQAVYFAAGLAEVGLLLILVGFTRAPIKGNSRGPGAGSLGPVGHRQDAVGSLHDRQERGA